MKIIWLAVLISVAASGKEEQCNKKHLGPWEEPLTEPKIPPALKNQLDGKPNENSAATFAKTNFNKIMQTVATTTPKEFKARGVKVDTIEASKGKIVGLRKAFSNPKSVAVTADGNSKKVNVKFDVDLTNLVFKFHVKAPKPKFNQGIEWKFLSGSMASVNIAIKLTPGCSMDFGATEVKSNFVPKKKSAQITTLTDKLKCYIHIILGQAVNFVLQILKSVLEGTVCLGLKSAKG